MRRSLVSTPIINSLAAVPLAYSLIRSLLFRLDAERAHDWANAGLRLAQRSGWLRRRWQRRWAVEDPRLAQKLLGLDFANPVGVAAGFDKNARLVPALAAFGFGAVEVGTVTPRPQTGNSKPRLWRHTDARSLQNSLGFNGAGMEAVAADLTALAPYPLPIGVNLGKNRDTEQSRALADYELLLRRFSLLANYFVINISSPNTPRLRELQQPDFIAAVLATAAELTAAPVLIKIAPDMPLTAAVELALAAVAAGAAGIIATNTTTDYSLLPGAEPRGGLSGAVLSARSYAITRALGAALADRAVLVSVGGIASAAEAYRRLRAGAHLVQLYSGLIYAGPSVPGQINRGLLALLERDGLDHITDAIGADR